MKKLDKKEVLKVIIKAAKEYHAKLEDKHFLIIYQDGRDVKTVCVGFRDMNFLHMTGLRSNKLSAQQFYEACLKNKLSERDFNIDKGGKVQQKLMVLPYLSELLYNNCMIGNFINSGICIKADYFVGNTKAVLSVGFRYGRTVDYPVTLYNENVKLLAKPVCKVLAVFVKEYTQSCYKECTYLSKGQIISKLPISEDIKKLVCIDNEKIQN